MIDLIYDFILYTLLGNPEFTGATELATLLTYTTIVLFFFILIKLTVWAFGFVFKWKRRRN